MSETYRTPPELVLGGRLNGRVPEADQVRQRQEVDQILARLRNQPGVVLADEVGMGKTYVALAIAYSVAMSTRCGPVILTVPANLVDKWVQDLNTFAELYLENRQPVARHGMGARSRTAPTELRYEVARHSIELMKLLDDSPGKRCHLIFLAHGAMGRGQTDKWVRLAMIAEALRRHGRGGASRLIRVKDTIHRYLGELLWARGEERAHGWGEALWQKLLKSSPDTWMEIYNGGVKEEHRLADDPVPKAVQRAIAKIDVRPLADGLLNMPVRSCGGETRVSERLNEARTALRKVEEGLWKELLAMTSWRSPLLVMDEAHHLKNPGTALARQLQSSESSEDLRTGDGAMAGAFDRMLFLTATPFQLGHHELIKVLERFGDVRWDEETLGAREAFLTRLQDLEGSLNASQRAAIALQKSWSRLRPEDCADVPNLEAWWTQLQGLDRSHLSRHQMAVLDAYETARRTREEAEKALRPWIVRHDKGFYWAGTTIARRQRRDGGTGDGQAGAGGLSIPANQLLAFFLAARSAETANKDLLGNALSSSYEAFRHTRENRVSEVDDVEEPGEPARDLTHSRWYLSEFDQALQECSGAQHPKVHATVQRVVDLWEQGEKVLVFAFYRRTCRALRVHISQEIERRLEAVGKRRHGAAPHEVGNGALEALIGRIQKRYFDDLDAPGRRAVDARLQALLESRQESLARAGVSWEQRTTLLDVMRRFLRVSSTLIRCFPLAGLDSMSPAEAVAATLAHTDGSGLSWAAKLDNFVHFLTDRCSREERERYLEAASRTQTGGIRVEAADAEDEGGPENAVTLANVQVATGATSREKRSRLMRAFNTPFFPDILVCSEVMGEGVDLHRFCGHVIHHDLAWNPSAIEQRTGRVDRLGCKAEGRQPIVVYLPYIAGTADERQYRVMSDRERWFRVVMGQDEVARLIRVDAEQGVPLPETVSRSLSFRLGLELDDKAVPA